MVSLLKDLPQQTTTAKRFLNLSYVLKPDGWQLMHDDHHCLINQLTSEQTAPYLLDVIMTTYYRESGYEYAFHGAAAQWQNTNIFLPAPSGSGKSTLFAHLTHQLKATPYSDEVIVLDSAFNPKQVPFPMTLKSGSWPLFADMTFLEPGWQRKDGRQLKYHFLSWQTPSLATKNMMIFPRYQADHQGGIQKIGPCKAIFNLSYSGYEFAHGENEAAISKLLNWLNSIDIYEMIYPDSKIAEALIRENL